MRVLLLLQPNMGVKGEVVCDPLTEAAEALLSFRGAVSRGRVTEEVSSSRTPILRHQGVG